MTPRWAIADALERPHLARQVVNVVDGERHVADALDAVEPLPLPPPGSLAHGSDVAARCGAGRRPARTIPR